MKYDFTTKVDRENTSATKINRPLVENYLGLKYYDDTISMWVADMEFKCAPQIIKAIKERADREIFGYTMISDEYYEAMIKWFKQRHNMSIERDWIVYSQGTIAAIRNGLRAFTNEGDGVIIQAPVYGPFSAQTQSTNRKVVVNYLKKDENNHYSIDFEDFEQKCKDPNNKMFIYCNPHNPVGRVWSKEDTQRLVSICKENDVIFFSDEVHQDILRKDVEFVSALNMEDSENVVVVVSLNKTFNLAGLHVTNFIIKNAELKKKLNDYTGMIRIQSLALEAAVAAYSECADWVDEMNEVIDENLDYMEGFIKEHLPKVKYTIPEGTYLAWLDFNGLELTEEEILKKCAEEAHLVLEGGSMFGEVGRGYIRINVACPKEQLKEALNRMKKVFSA